MDTKKYKEFLENKHEYQVMNHIELKAIENGYKVFKEDKDYMPEDKLIFKFRNKLIALVELGLDISQGVNMIISHIDSPRLDVIPNNPIVTKDDDIFFKVVSYGGIISQSWLDRPLALIGKAYDKDGNVVNINTEDDNILFTISSLLPHLDGRKEMKELKAEKLMVRVGQGALAYLSERGITNDNLKLADLSFVPAGKPIDIGFNGDLIGAYGHDDRVCAFAELEAILNSKPSDKTKIAIFTSYEETGSGQSSGAESQFIDDIFLELTKGNQLTMRRTMRNTKVISADVCAGFESNYSSHFEENCKVIPGKGIGIVPFLGNKRGNDATLEMREFMKKLCEDNNISYQIETTKVGEKGGGTVSTFFGIKGMEVIDVGVPVLAMHSPQELIHKKDLISAYELYKVFYEK